jgi:hypothetical protein
MDSTERIMTREELQIGRTVYVASRASELPHITECVVAARGGPYKGITLKRPETGRNIIFPVWDRIHPTYETALAWLKERVADRQRLQNEKLWELDAAEARPA